MPNPKEEFVEKVVESAMNQLLLQLQADLGPDFKIYVDMETKISLALADEVRIHLWKEQMNKEEENTKDGS